MHNNLYKLNYLKKICLEVKFGRLKKMKRIIKT